MPEWMLTVLGMVGGSALTIFAAGRVFGRYTTAHIALESRVNKLEAETGDYARIKDVVAMKQDFDERRKSVDERLESKVHVNDLAAVNRVVELLRADLLRENDQLRVELRRQSESYHARIQEVNGNILKLSLQMTMKGGAAGV